MEIVLTRKKIKDCFIKPYNPLFLKAANAEVYVNPTIGSQVLAHSLTQRTVETLPDVLLEKVSSLIFSHTEISLAEALSLLDPKMKRIKSSSTAEFVTAVKPEKRNLTFLKIYEMSETSIKHIDSDQYFEICYSNIMRYTIRIGMLKLMLSQFVIWFDYTGREMSKLLFERYFEKKIEIPLSEEELVSLENEKQYLPEYILLENGNVMKKRKMQKILVYPKFKKETKEHMYSKLLLYSSFIKENELVGPDSTLEDKFKEDLGGEMSKIDILEMRLFSLMKQI